MGEAPIPDLREDSEGVGVTQTSLPSLDGNDSLVGLNDVQGKGGLETEPDPVVNVDLPLSSRDATGLGVVDGVNTSVEVLLTSGNIVSGDWNVVAQSASLCR